jgi:hypothetical protein
MTRRTLVGLVEDIPEHASRSASVDQVAQISTEANQKTTGRSSATGLFAA